jgi:hypothetical protein
LIEAAAARRQPMRHIGGAELVGKMARKHVLQFQFLFLQAVEKVLVGMVSMLFFLNQSVKSRVL